MTLLAALKMLGAAMRRLRRRRRPLLIQSYEEFLLSAGPFIPTTEGDAAMQMQIARSYVRNPREVS
jgi:hypothetical protein